MPIFVPDQGEVGLGGSRINPADTYVRTTPQDVSSGFEALSRALSGWGSSMDAESKRAKAEQERLDSEKIPYYVSQFSREMESGLVDEIQVGKRLPTDSKMIAAKVTEGIGAQQWEQYARQRMEVALRDDESIRTDPVKRKAFFDQLRGDMVEATKGRDFYGAGAARAVEGVINEFEGNFQREGAKLYQDQQEGEFQSGVSEALKNQPATGQHGALLDFISKPESGGNYNAYYGNTGNTSTKFTNMTIADVMQWQREYVARGNPSSAVGKYQFIQTTLRDVVKDLGLDPNTTRFTPEVQDRLAERLLEKRGLNDYLAGKISKEEFGNRLAQEWAGLPQVTGPNAGKSFYEGDGLNHSGAKVGDFLAVLDQRGPSSNGISQVDQLFAKTSGINPIRRRELIVDTAINMAISSGDSSILDRVEKMAVNPDGTSFLLEENKAKIEKARQDVADVSYRRFTQNLTLQEKVRDEQERVWRNDMVTRFIKNQPIDIAKDAIGADGTIDANKRKFLLDLEASSNVSATDSAEASANLSDQLLSASTYGGSYKDIFKNDLVLGPVVASGASPSADQIRDYINRRRDISPADKEKLVGKVDTLMEGVSLLRDPDITTAFKEGIGTDVQSFVQNKVNMGTMIRNPNLASVVQQAYMGEVKRQVKADIEDGKGIPRGNRKLEIIDKAQAKAKEKFTELIGRERQQSADNTKTNTPPASKPSVPPPPKVGEVVNGYQFLGGDPANQENWKKM